MPGRRQSGPLPETPSRHPLKAGLRFQLSPDATKRNKYGYSHGPAFSVIGLVQRRWIFGFSAPTYGTVESTSTIAAAICVTTQRF